MRDNLSCSMHTVVAGPGAVFDSDRGEWLQPCPDPVAGLAHEDGAPYCAWHLELMDEPPLMWFVVTPHGIEGPIDEHEF